MTIKKACEILDVIFDPRYKLSQSYKDMMLDEAKEKFLIKIKTNHPDVGGTDDKARELIEAHEYLKKTLSIKERVSVTEWFNLMQERRKERMQDPKYIEELNKKKAEYNRKNREKRAAFRLANPPKPRGKPILQITENGEIVKEWPSAKDAAQALNTDVSAICKCAKGVKYYKLAAGFAWKYKLTQGVGPAIVAA